MIEFDQVFQVQWLSASLYVSTKIYQHKWAFVCVDAWLRVCVSGCVGSREFLKKLYALTCHLLVYLKWKWHTGQHTCKHSVTTTCIHTNKHTLQVLTVLVVMDHCSRSTKRREYNKSISYAWHNMSQWFYLEHMKNVLICMHHMRMQGAIRQRAVRHKPFVSSKEECVPKQVKKILYAESVNNIKSSLIKHLIACSTFPYW